MRVLHFVCGCMTTRSRQFAAVVLGPAAEARAAAAGKAASDKITAAAAAAAARAHSDPRSMQPEPEDGAAAAVVAAAEARDKSRAASDAEAGEIYAQGCLAVPESALLAAARADHLEVRYL